MQDRLSFSIRKTGVFIFLVLIITRTVYEATWDKTPWCTDYALTIVYYGISLLAIFALPCSGNCWKSHTGKLSTALLLLGLTTCEVTYISFWCEGSPLDLPLGKGVAYATLAIAYGFGMSRLSDAIRERETKIRHMAAGVSEACWEVDCSTNTATLSESFGRMFGYKPGEIVSSIAGWSGLTHPDDLTRVVTSFDRAAKSGAESWEETYRMRRADGSYAVVIDRCRFERDKTGAAICAYGGILDITVRVEMEKRLRDLNEQLESRIAHRTNELSRVTFAITHDLKSPLTSIMGYADLASERESVKNDPTAKRHLDQVILNAERMQSFIMAILDKARSTPSPFKQTVSLGEIFEALAGELTPRFAKAGGTLRHDAASLQVSADKDTLHRIFQNLVDNALKFSRPGVPPVVSLTAASMGSGVTITVEDNGQGIPQDALTQIFDLHYRAGPHLETEGHGVGLANVKEEITRLNGTIRVESAVGVGTRFIISLPTSPQ